VSDLLDAEVAHAPPCPGPAQAAGRTRPRRPATPPLWDQAAAGAFRLRRRLIAWNAPLAASAPLLGVFRAQSGLGTNCAEPRSRCNSRALDAASGAAAAVILSLEALLRPPLRHHAGAKWREPRVSELTTQLAWVRQRRELTKLGPARPAARAWCWWGDGPLVDQTLRPSLLAWQPLAPTAGQLGSAVHGPAPGSALPRGQPTRARRCWPPCLAVGGPPLLSCCMVAPWPWGRLLLRAVLGHGPAVAATAHRPCAAVRAQGPGYHRGDWPWLYNLGVLGRLLTRRLAKTPLDQTTESAEEPKSGNLVCLLGWWSRWLASASTARF